MTDLKILALDIETMPALVWTYDLFRPFISHKQIVEPSRISCFSYQWYGDKSVKFASEYHNGRSEMLDLLWKLMDDADVILGYNTKRFDTPWVLGELMVEGRTKPSPVKHIDLYQVMRSNTRFLSRKLDYVSSRLLDDKKIDVNTMTLAIECASSDPEVAAKAWAKMKRYSLKDTKLMFPLFERVRSYVKMPHPINSDGYSCHACGSHALQRRGREKTLNGSYQRLWCTSCGSWSRGTERQSDTEIRAV